jgi:4-amino-4-deoxy-L-arabinose transferase-like glycosyltransferase
MASVVRVAARPATALAALALAFVAITAWWLAVDTGTQSWDPGRHLNIAAGALSLLRDGDLLGPYTAIHQPDYPPVAHVLGAVALALTGADAGVDAPVLALNLVFVPLLVLGVYGTGRLVAGPRAGLLAAVFALGTPIAISQFHLFQLDLPLAAMVAVSVWLLLESRRFSRVRWAALAGAAMGLGFLVKQTLPFYVVGVLVVLLARGGWRHWRGVLACAAAGGVLAIPWYLVHRGEQGAALDGGVSIAQGADPNRDVWTLDNFGWYLRAALDVQLLAPLGLIAGVGMAVLAVRALRARPLPHTAELAGGLAAGVALAGSLLVLDVRYTAPLLVYLAVAAAAWIVLLPRRAGVLAAAALVIVCVMNTAVINLGIGSAVRVEHAGVLVSPQGYVAGEPFDGGDAAEVLRAARAEGARRMAVDWPATEHADFSLDGMTVNARMAGLDMVPGNDTAALRAGDVLVVRREPGAAGPAPCARARDGAGLHLSRPGGRLFCPGGAGGSGTPREDT